MMQGQEEDSLMLAFSTRFALYASHVGHPLPWKVQVKKKRAHCSMSYDAAVSFQWGEIGNRDG